VRAWGLVQVGWIKKEKFFAERVPRKYWTRCGVAEWLIERLAEDAPTLVGIDHEFFPAALLRGAPPSTPALRHLILLPVASYTMLLKRWVDKLRECTAGADRCSSSLRNSSGIRVPGQ
jgi:hypothetical protein